MKGITAFLSSSRERLKATRSLVRHAAPDGDAAPVAGAAGMEDAAIADDLIALCDAVDDANAAALEAAILYLQNRYTSFDLIEAETADADFIPANDVSARDVSGRDVAGRVEDHDSPAAMPVQATAVVVPPAPLPKPADAAAVAHLFGFSETSLFHTGQDWILLDDVRVDKAPAA